LTSASVGVVSLGVGVFFGMKARTIADELSTPGNTFYVDRDASGRQAGQIALVTTVSGGVLLVGGITMYLMGRSKRSDGVAVLPSVDPGSAGIVVRGSF
jgi:hypothetical protein